MTLTDIQQMFLVGIHATQDLKRGSDPAYFHLPAQDSEMLTFSLFDLLRRRGSEGEAVARRGRRQAREGRPDRGQQMRKTLWSIAALAAIVVGLIVLGARPVTGNDALTVIGLAVLIAAIVAVLIAGAGHVRSDQKILGRS
jgi:hypothetical protein